MSKKEDDEGIEVYRTYFCGQIIKIFDINCTVDDCVKKIKVSKDFLSAFLSHMYTEEIEVNFESYSASSKKDGGKFEIPGEPSKPWFSSQVFSWKFDEIHERFTIDDLLGGHVSISFRKVVYYMTLQRIKTEGESKRVALIIQTATGYCVPFFHLCSASFILSLLTLVLLHTNDEDEDVIYLKYIALPCALALTLLFGYAGNYHCARKMKVGFQHNRLHHDLKNYFEEYRV